MNKAILLCGVANGKNTLINHFFGKEKKKSIDLSYMIKNTFGLSDIIGYQKVLVSIDKEKLMEDGKLRALLAGEEMEVRIKRKESVFQSFGDVKFVFMYSGDFKDLHLSPAMLRRINCFKLEICK